jgi:hypothetical protein
MEPKPLSATKEPYDPPKILATYSKGDLEERIQQTGIHGNGGCGTGCGCGSIPDPWLGPGPDPRP